MALISSTTSVLCFASWTSPPPPPNGVRAPIGPGPPHCRGFTITDTHHFGRNPLDEWSIRRRPLPDNTHKTHPCPRRDSNLQSQHASGRRPTPQTVRPLGSALDEFYCKLSVTNMTKWVNLLAYVLCCVSINRHCTVLFYIPVHSSPYVILCSSYTHLFSAFFVILQLFLRLLWGW